MSATGEGRSSTRAGGTGVRHEVSLVCVDCGSGDQDLSGRCKACGGMVEAVYPPADAVLEPGDTDSLETYWELLPIPDRSTCRIAIWPTPTILLAELDGVPIYAKVEGCSPPGRPRTASSPSPSRS